MEHGWCAKVSSLLRIADHDSREKVLHAMLTLKPSCHLQFGSDAVSLLETLRREYVALCRGGAVRARRGWTMTATAKIIRITREYCRLLIASSMTSAARRRESSCSRCGSVIGSRQGFCFEGGGTRILKF